MTPDGPVFERNLEQLLTRCYVPVRARPRFESDLLADFLAEFERSNARWARRRHALTRPSFGWVGAAVAAAAALMVWLLLVPPDDDGSGAPAPLARVEHRFTAEGDFAPADGAERFDATWPEFYELKTGEAARGAIELAQAGSVQLEPDSHLVASVGDTHDADLLAGSASFAKSDAVPDWFLAADGARIRFERGELALHLDGALEVFLASGRAVLLTDGGPVVLPLGSTTVVDGGVAASALLALEEPTPARRAELPVEAVEAPEPPTVVDAPVERRLRGRVVDPDGAPVPAFRVHLLVVQDYSNVTDPVSRHFETSDGFWVWEDPPAGLHELFIEAPGYSVWRARQPVDTAPEFVEVADARLDRGLAITGTVYDRETGRPVEGAAVVCEADLPLSVIPLDPAELEALNLTGVVHTDADGVFRLPNVSRGKQILRASAAGFGPRWSRVLEVTPSEPAPEVTFELEPGASVSGHVYASDGSPWAGAHLVSTTVDMGGRQERMSYNFGVTDEEGRYEIADLPRSMMVVVLLGEEYEGGFPPQVQPVNLTSVESATVDFGSAVSGTRLFGRLLDPDGSPLARVPLSILHEGVDPRGGSEGWVGGASDGEGRYSFDQVLPGVNQFCVTSDLGESVTVVDAVDVPDWFEFEHDVRLGRKRIHGQVTDAAGEPVFYAAVIAEKLGEDGAPTRFAAKAMTNLDGSYSIRYLKPGVYRVTIYPTSSEAPKAVPRVEVEDADEELRVDVALESGAVLELTVVDVAGRPVAEALVATVDPRTGEAYEQPYLSSTDADGRLQLLPGAPGPLIIEVSKPGFSPTRSEWNLRVGTQKGRVVLSEL